MEVRPRQIHASWRGLSRRCPARNNRVIVEPKGTSEPVTAVLKIKTDYPVENPKEYTAVARIK
jgi:hypothetical protein